MELIDATHECDVEALDSYPCDWAEAVTRMSMLLCWKPDEHAICGNSLQFGLMRELEIDSCEEWSSCSRGTVNVSTMDDDKLWKRSRDGEFFYLGAATCVGT